MSYGLQISASGLAASLYRQDVFANNLANMDTVGFKPDLPTARPRQAVREEDHLPDLPSDALLERLGGGTLLNPNLTNFAQGATRVTNNNYDLAIEGDGFFMLQSQSDANSQQVRVSRDGRFTRNAQGKLVSVSAGLPVLDESNRPISIPDGAPVSIGSDGTIRQSGNTIAKIRLVSFPNPQLLAKAGGGSFTAPVTALSARSAASGTIRQGAVEDSGVKEITTLMAITGAAREAESNSWLIQQHDRLSERAIAALGRVA
ncbi:MAG: flagellar hook basal-body protein [Planctomycetes bacterium]|nr:flagellar hook basal-body protein [Planctomycetota bacterium]